VTGGPADEAVLGDPARPAWAQILSAVTEDPSAMTPPVEPGDTG
jgi:hypothetical protein